MVHTTHMNFADVLSEIKHYNLKKSILLGNGFVIAGGYDTLKYSSIAEEIINDQDLQISTSLKNFLKRKLDQNHLNLECHLKIFQESVSAIDYLHDTGYCSALYITAINDIKNTLNDDRIKLKESVLIKIKNYIRIAI